MDGLFQWFADVTRQHAMRATTFLIRHKVTGRYVQQRPYDGAWTWLAPWATYATVFPERGYAEQIAKHMEQEDPGCAEILELDGDGRMVSCVDAPEQTRGAA